MDFTVKINLNLDSIEQLKQIYGENLINKIYSITTDYNQRIIRDAKEILRTEDKIDTRRLRNSIKQSARVYSTRFINSIYSGTKYARFVHEGAEHKDSKIVPHFVSFKTAPYLFGQKNIRLFKKYKVIGISLTNIMANI